MNSKQNASSSLSEVNGQFSVPLLQPTGSEEEKWDLGWLGAVLRRRALLIASVSLGTIAVASGLLFFMSSSTPPKFSGRFQLLVEPVTAEQQQARSAARAQGAETIQPEQINIQQSSLDYETQIRILQGPKLMNPIVKQLQTRYPDITYEQLINSLKIARLTTLTADKREQGTKLIEVSYQDSDPQKVQYILEQVSSAYLRYSLKERQSSIRQGVKFIDSQLPQLRQRVNALQGQIQALRERYTIVDPDLQGQQLTQRAGTLGQQQADSQTQLAETQAKQRTLQQQLQNSNLQSVVGEAAYYQALLTQYQQIESQLAIESARLQPGNPTLQALEEKRQKLQSVLRQEADRVVGKASDSITVATARDRAIAQSGAEVNQKIQQLPNVARQYTDLQRELVIANESLNKFSSRQEALEIDAVQQEVPWELIRPPELVKDQLGKPINVDATSKVRFLALIAILGLLLGVGVGFLVEISKDVLQTTDEVKRSAQLPLLGNIPFNDAKTIASPGWLGGLFQARSTAKPNANQAAGVDRNSLYNAFPFIEAFRSLYKNIRLLPLRAPVRSLTISSPEPGDGKSTIAVNLAQAAAAMGQRVLLVDADLRHPQVHSQMNLSNECGLSDILTSNINVRNVLQQSPLKDNLMVLTAGKPTLDPVELLSSGKMQLLMERFQMVFDLVIYDTPPLLGLADGSLIAAQTNGLVLVIRMGKTKRLALNQTLEEVKISSTNVLGLVANGAKDAANTPYGYYRPYVQSQNQNGSAPVEV
ncbi:MAG: polysaccharide biosynthesis tyrosine autokinase [Tildeniella nuda ZEHNDER 1965/U140]|jgi:capsular exopolysaccharide synthesis family protein|nr:polysaccharide biosynthesis tyrosine autokinase [Tildeniella nuda ZEHNDER 1965/U140]